MRRHLVYRARASLFARVRASVRVLQYSFVLALSVFCPAWGASPSGEPVGTFNVVGVSIAELAHAQGQGRVTSLQLVDLYLARIAQLDRAGPSLHSVLALNPNARADARALDRERSAGHARGPLHGIPLLIKDNIETADPMPTTAGSLALVDNMGRRDAPLIARLRAAGAVILGKTNLSEWASMRSAVSVSGWSAVGGQTLNPYALDRSPCGSSSGSGAAVAASLAAAAVGTETDGSITCPASLNGVVGIKPTVGLVSRTHVVPLSHSQDTPGPITHTVADAALLLGVMTGTDPQDPATASADAHTWNSSDAFAPADLKGVRVGVIRIKNALPQVEALLNSAIRRLTEAGVTVVEVDAPSGDAQLGEQEETVLLTELKADLAAYLATTPAQVKARTLGDLIQFNREHAAREMPIFGQDLFEQAELTTGLQDPVYLKAREDSKLAAGRDGLDKLLVSHQLQAIIAPTMGPAYLIDTIAGDTISASGPGGFPAIAGYPHLTLPMGMVKGLPVGLSLIGTAWTDRALLALGASVERVLGPVPGPRYLAHTAMQ